MANGESDDQKGLPPDLRTGPKYQFDPNNYLSFQALSEMQRSLTTIEVQLDTLIKNFEKAETKIGVLDRTVDRFKTGIYVATPLILGFLAFLWWAIGDHVTTAVHTGIDQALKAQIQDAVKGGGKK